jgi:hypothetical protein
VKIRLTSTELRKTLRTALAVAASLALLVPVLVDAGVLDSSRWPWVASVVAVAAFVTRLMQNPTVDAVLGKVLGAPFTIDGVPAAARSQAGEPDAAGSFTSDPGPSGPGY